MKISLKKICEITNGIKVSGDDNLIIENYTKDTRNINENDTYIGIKGASFDGSLFYQDAFDKGAIACIIEKNSYDNSYNGSKGLILVDNSIDAIRDIACYIRSISNSLFIGVTGSVGKTCTRDMIYSILSQNHNLCHTKGNLNNHIGMPMTLLEVKEDNDISLIEMGMNHLEEIDYLTNILKPNIGIITNVGTAHIGELGSRDNILKAKLEILNGMDENSKLIINYDNDKLHDYFSSRLDENIITIGIDNESDMMACDIDLKEDGTSFKVKYKDEEFLSYINVPGKANVYNALIAYATAKLIGLSFDEIQSGMDNLIRTSSRLEKLKKNDITVINDAYNASYDSIVLASNVLNRYQTKKTLVLGDVFGLGDFAKEIHTNIGDYVSKLNIDQIVCIGDNAKYIYDKAVLNGHKNVNHFNDFESAIEFLNNNTSGNDTVLFKASHGMKFNKLIDMYLGK